jgi:hypothetical protein
MRRLLSYIRIVCMMLSSICMVLVTASCRKKVDMTQILIQDSIRHYYPMIQGSDLVLSFRVANIGETPLVLTDIQPSCGCVSGDIVGEAIIPPHKETILKFTYHSERNSGYVRHTVRIFGNIAPSGMASMTFDTHVVPPAISSPDYEQLHKERDEYDIMSGAKTLIDGESPDLGYWTVAGEYSRGYNRYYWHGKEKDK